ncbi:MAG TPA: hypothetical protein PLN25_03425 [Deltaproteobacteria bacterium]|nr:hypothetical protein [Deltaproteobacteria bacterium]HQB39827.1 hypothetical protein [Deltaproteobacteria bacterium]
MIGLIFFGAIFFWAWLGVKLWKRFIKPYVPSTKLGTCLTLFLAAVWFIGPVFDEILGAWQFKQLCREMPSTKFYGPIAVGPGVFFDEQGQPKWKNSDEFSAIRRKTNVWEKEMFKFYDEGRTLRKWPMPIEEVHNVYLDRTTGKTTLESFARYSKGGWLRRFTGMGGYQCPIKGRYPRDEERIIFKAK